MSPLADPAVLALSSARGYHPIELTSVMHMRLTRDRLPSSRAGGPELRVRTIDADEGAAVGGNGGARLGRDAGARRVHAGDRGGSARATKGNVCFVAEWNGHPIAAAALGMHDGVAMLAGASTDPAFRGRGAQAALLDARLRHAASAGCDIAMMGAAPGSASQRNGERQGFRIAYTRIKWQHAERHVRGVART